jgi:hypothetical protein
MGWYSLFQLTFYKAEYSSNQQAIQQSRFNIGRPRPVYVLSKQSCSLAAIQALYM